MMHFSSQRIGINDSKATLGNGIGAVLAGLVAGYVADLYGYVAPFIVCLIPLVRI